MLWEADAEKSCKGGLIILERKEYRSIRVILEEVEGEDV